MKTEKALLTATLVALTMGMGSLGCEAEEPTCNGGYCFTCPGGHLCPAVGYGCGDNGTCLKKGTGDEPATPSSTNPPSGTTTAPAGTAGNQDADRYSLVGLYGHAGGPYAYLGADGRFFFGQPACRADGSVDFEVSAAKLKPNQKGTYRTEEIPGMPPLGKGERRGARSAILSFEDGTTATHELSVYDISGSSWRLGQFNLSKFGYKILPLPQEDLFGTFKDEFSATAGDRNFSVNYERVTRIQFLAGRKFKWTNMVTNSVLSATPVGPTGVANVTGVETENFSYAGTYEVRGFVVTLTTTEGRKMEDVLETSKGNTLLYWGRKQYTNF